MANSEPSRLDRIEALLSALADRDEASAIRQNEFDQRLEVTRQIVDSNARAIEANASAIAELRQQDAIAAQELRTNVQDMVGMVGTIAEEMQEMQSEIRGLQTENRRILERLERRDEQGGDRA